MRSADINRVTPLRQDYVPVAEEIMAAEDAERDAWIEIRQRTYAYFAAELTEAHQAQTVPALIARWFAESLRA